MEMKIAETFPIRHIVADGLLNDVDDNHYNDDEDDDDDDDSGYDFR